MSKTKTYEQALCRALDAFFSLHGYQFYPDLKQFRRKTPSGFQNVILTFSDGIDGTTHLNLHLGTRIEAVEQIAQQFIDSRPGYREHANTIITSIGSLNKIKYFNYKLSDLSDVTGVAYNIERFMEAKGFPFLTRYSTLKAVGNALNTTPKKPCTLLYNQSHRYFKGLVASKLMVSQDFTKLSVVYGNYLKISDALERTQQNFARLITFLSYYTPN